MQNPLGPPLAPSHCETGTAPSTESAIYRTSSARYPVPAHPLLGREIPGTPPGPNKPQPRVAFFRSGRARARARRAFCPHPIVQPALRPHYIAVGRAAPLPEAQPRRHAVHEKAGEALGPASGAGPDPAAHSRHQGHGQNRQRVDQPGQPARERHPQARAEARRDEAPRARGRRARVAPPGQGVEHGALRLRRAHRVVAHHAQRGPENHRKVQDRQAHAPEVRSPVFGKKQSASFSFSAHLTPLSSQGTSSKSPSGPRPCWRPSPTSTSWSSRRG